MTDTMAFTGTAQRPMADLLIEAMLMNEVVRRSILGDKSFVEGKRTGTIAGFAYAYEVLSGIPADVVVEALSNVPQKTLSAFVRGDIDTVRFV